MKTMRLFQQSPYMKEFQATLLEVAEKDGAPLLVLNQTAFFPTGGGQSCDLGFIDNSQVIDVFEKNGIIYHHLSGETHMGPGDKVTGRIDWPRRFHNMQRHCGEHILSGIFFREYGGVNRGFHMGDEYMTIDISLEGDSQHTILTWEMALQAEILANEVIWQNLPVITRTYEDPLQASKLPLRKQLTVEEDITIVCVGSTENPADCVACCGTHPAFAGEVGLIKILKVESYKGMFRVYFKAGSDALLDYQEKHEIINKLNARHSATTKDLLEKIQVQEEKNKGVRNQLHQIRQMVIQERVLETESALEESTGILVKEFPVLTVEDLLQIGRAVAPKIKKLLILTSWSESTLLLFSNGKTVNCGKLVKETAPIYSGKGGGNDIQARAIFPHSENIPTYIDLIEKHLR